MCQTLCSALRIHEHYTESTFETLTSRRLINTTSWKKFPEAWEKLSNSRWPAALASVSYLHTWTLASQTKWAWWGAGIPPFHEEEETAFQRGTVTWQKQHSAYKIEFSYSKAVLLPCLIAFPKYRCKGLQTTACCRERALHNCLIDTEPEIPFGTFGLQRI